MQGVPISNPFSVDSSPEYSSPKARKGHPLLIPDDIAEEGGLDEYLMEAEGTKTPIEDTKRHVSPSSTSESYPSNEDRFNPSKPSEETLFFPPLNLPFIPSGGSDHDKPLQELLSESFIPNDPLLDLKRQMADAAESVSII